MPCIIFESVPELKPLGVGINLQPNAVHELYDLGLGAEQLDTIGIQAREWALVGRNGNDVYSEPRGRLAGYRWPQYSVHRRQLQMLLVRTVCERLGPQAVRLGQRVTGYRQDADGVTALLQTRDGATLEVAGRLLVAADGFIPPCAQMYPQRRLLRRRRLGAASRGAVPDLAGRPGARPGNDKLDCRDHGGQPQLPAHQFSSLALLDRGSVIASRIDLRMPGMDNRNIVS